MRKFLETVNPDGPGWEKVRSEAKNEGYELNFTHEDDSLPKGILCMVLGCTGIYSLLFAIGYWIYGKTGLMSGLLVLSALATIALFKIWGSKKQA